MSAPAHRSSESSALWPVLGQVGIQTLRFLSKAAIVLIAAAPHYGVVAGVGVASFLAATLVTAGLDHAAIRTPVFAVGWFRKGQRLQVRLGLLAGALFAAMGGVCALRGNATLATALLGVAPTLPIGAAAVLPMAALVRAQRLRTVLLVDAAGVLSLAGGVALGATLSLGAGSLLLGWNLQALITLLLSARAARRTPLPEEVGGTGMSETLRFGWGCAFGAALLLVGERIDLALTLAVRPLATWLGRPESETADLDGASRLGIYEFSQGIAWTGVAFVAAILDRWLFPHLARSHAVGRLGTNAVRAFAHLLAWAVPPYLIFVAAASMRRASVEGALDPSWSGLSETAAPQAFNALSQLVLLMGLLTLRAAGRGTATARVALLLIVLMATIGVTATWMSFEFRALGRETLGDLAWAAGVARILAAGVALASLRSLWRLSDDRARGAFGRVFWFVSISTALTVGALAWHARTEVSNERSPGYTFATLLLLSLAMLVARWALDRRSLHDEWVFSAP